MGNCSSAAIHDKAMAEVEAEAGTELITVVRRSKDGELLKYPAPVFVKDIVAGLRGFAVFSFNKPLHPDTQLSFNSSYHLKPLFPERPHNSSAHDHHSHTHAKPRGPEISQTYLRQRPEAAVPVTTEAPALKRPKSPKKVRFAEEPVLIPSHSEHINEGGISSWTSSFNGQRTIRQRLSAEPRDSKDQLLSGDDGVIRCPPSCPPVADDQLFSTRTLRQRVTFNGIFRLKVVVSRKDLTELMSLETPQSRAEGMAERIISPLLSPQQTAVA